MSVRGEDTGLFAARGGGGPASTMETHAGGTGAAERREPCTERLLPRPPGEGRRGLERPASPIGREAVVRLYPKCGYGDPMCCPGVTRTHSHKEGAHARLRVEWE